MRHLLIAVAIVGCYNPPTAVEPEPCTVYIVSAITGDTTVVSPWSGPPLSEIELFDVADVWYEGECEW